MRHLVYLKAAIGKIAIDLDNYNVILSFVTALMMIFIFIKAHINRAMNKQQTAGKEQLATGRVQLLSV